MHVAGRELLDGASAIYAFAPKHRRHDLEIAAEELRLVNVPGLTDHTQILQLIEFMHRDDQDVLLTRTAEFEAWLKWKIALDNVHMSIVPLLLDGILTAFGDLNYPGSHPHWIDPGWWPGAKSYPDMHGKFSGHDLVFWNVRLVNTLEVMAQDKEQDALQATIKPAKPKRITLTRDVEKWFKSYRDRFTKDRFHPPLSKDLAAARIELDDETISRAEIESLRRQFVAPDRTPIGRRPKSPR